MESSLSKSEEAQTTHSLKRQIMVCPTAYSKPPDGTVVTHSHQGMTGPSGKVAGVGGTTTTLSSDGQDKQPSAIEFQYTTSIDTCN